MQKSFKYFDHTADLGIEAWGKDRKELFVNAANAIINYMIGQKKIKEAEEISISCEGIDLESLFVNFLSEILYLISCKSFFPKHILITSLSDFKILAKVSGTFLHDASEYVNSEIKAITYHNIQILQQKGKYVVKFVCDI